MRLKLRRQMRRDWSKYRACDALLERDLSVYGSRLKAKLLIFRTRTDLRRFWRDGLQTGELGRRCMGAVNSLIVEVQFFPKGKPERRWLEADQRYFCVIGLVRGFLSMEIISHESVHAGFAYAKRIKRTPWEKQALDFDEEAVCYPAGAIAAAINRAVYKAGLHQ